MSTDKKLYDFRPFGRAIKEARLQRRMTRNEVAEIIDIDPRYLTNIENKGQHTSLNVLHKLVTFFDLSVDEHFFPTAKPTTSSRRRRLNKTLDSFDDKDLIIMEATANGIAQSKKKP